MAFTRVQKHAGQGFRSASDALRVARYASSDELVVTIPSIIYGKIGSPTHLALSIGTDSDAGWILLSPAKDSKTGYAVRRPQGSLSFQCKLPSKATGVGVFSTTPTEFEVTRVGLLVALPAAALASPSLAKRDTQHVNGAAVEAAA